MNSNDKLAEAVVAAWKAMEACDEGQFSVSDIRLEAAILAADAILHPPVDDEAVAASTGDEVAVAVMGDNHLALLEGRDFGRGSVICWWEFPKGAKFYASPPADRQDGDASALEFLARAYEASDNTVIAKALRTNGPGGNSYDYEIAIKAISAALSAKDAAPAPVELIGVADAIAAQAGKDGGA